MKRATHLTLSYRLEIASRSLAAAFGGLAFAGAIGWLVHWLLMTTGVQPKAVAVVTGTYVSWLVWSLAAMWAFHARTQRSAWVWLAAPAALIALFMVINGGG
jgi:hypothetical protein